MLLAKTPGTTPYVGTWGLLFLPCVSKRATIERIVGSYAVRYDCLLVGIHIGEAKRPNIVLGGFNVAIGYHRREANKRAAHRNSAIGIAYISHR